MECIGLAHTVVLDSITPANMDQSALTVEPLL